MTPFQDYPFEKADLSSFLYAGNGSLEKESNNLQREAKTYLDAMRAMSASQTRIADTLEVFYTADRAGEGAMAGHAYKAAVDELDNVVARDLVSVKGIGTGQGIRIISALGEIGCGARKADEPPERHRDRPSVQGFAAASGFPVMQPVSRVPIRLQDLVLVELEKAACRGRRSTLIKPGAKSFKPADRYIPCLSCV